MHCKYMQPLKEASCDSATTVVHRPDANASCSHASQSFRKSSRKWFPSLLPWKSHRSRASSAASAGVASRMVICFSLCLCLRQIKNDFPLIPLLTWTSHFVFIDEVL